MIEKTTLTAKETKDTNKETNLVSEQNPVTTKEQEVKGEEKTNPNQNTSTIDLEAIANGDFSSIAGTWENYERSSVIFDNKGIVAFIYYDEGNQIVNDTNAIQVFRIENNVLHAGITSRVQVAGGAGLLIVPKGTKTPSEKLIYEQDAILMGQSSKAEYDPYYKISDDTTAPESVATTEAIEQ